MTDTSGATALLAIIAIATTVQAFIFAGAAVMILRAYRTASARVLALERQLQPALDKVDRVLDAVEDTAARIRGVEDGIRHTAAEAREVARRSVLRLKADWWPAIAAAKAATAAVRVFTGRDRPRHLKAVPPQRASVAREEDEKTRFDYEGGRHVRS